MLGSIEIRQIIDKRKIESNINKDVLRARRFPEIRFQSRSAVREGDPYASGRATYALQCFLHDDEEHVRLAGVRALVEAGAKDEEVYVHARKYTLVDSILQLARITLQVEQLPLRTWCQEASLLMQR